MCVQRSLFANRKKFIVTSTPISPDDQLNQRIKRILADMISTQHVTAYRVSEENIGNIY